MGRHWQNIKLNKGKSDAQRAAKFTQLGRAITMAAKEKGGDPDMNAKLYTAIEKAKEAFMPKDNIERAIKKGTGELESEQLVELLYEGFGPGGAAVLVESVTDNRNRAAGNIKNVFTKNGGSMGSVAWMFDRKGVITVPKDLLLGKDPDEVALELIDWGADDVHVEPEGLTVLTSPENFLKVKEEVGKKLRYAAPDAAIEYVAKEPFAVPEGQKGALIDLLDALEEDEDVRAVHTNGDI